MAIAEIIEINKDIVSFTLSNKPHLTCMMNLKDFKQFMEGCESWYIHESSYNRRYIRRSRKGKPCHYHLHREIMGVGAYTRQTTIDHINGNGLDNRRINLEIVSASENTRRGRYGKSQAGEHYRGILINYLPSRNGFQAYDSLHCKNKYVAFATTKEKIKKKIDNYIESKGESNECR